MRGVSNLPTYPLLCCSIPRAALSFISVTLISVISLSPLVRCFPPYRTSLLDDQVLGHLDFEGTHYHRLLVSNTPLLCKHFDAKEPKTDLLFLFCFDAAKPITIDAKRKLSLSSKSFGLLEA